MNIVTGVLLIVAALLNALAGIPFYGSGKMYLAMKKMGATTGNSETEINGKIVKVPEDKHLIVGIYFFSAAIFMIIGGIFSFMGAYPTVILISALLSAGAEAIGILGISFSFTNIPGLLAAATALYTAVRLF